MIKHYYDVWHIAKGTFHVMIIECMIHVIGVKKTKGIGEAERL